MHDAAFMCVAKGTGKVECNQLCVSGRDRSLRRCFLEIRTSEVLHLYVRLPARQFSCVVDPNDVLVAKPEEKPGFSKKPLSCIFVGGDEGMRLEDLHRKVEVEA